MYCMAEQYRPHPSLSLCPLPHSGAPRSGHRQSGGQPAVVLRHLHRGGGAHVLRRLPAHLPPALPGHEAGAQGRVAVQALQGAAGEAQASRGVVARVVRLALLLVVGQACPCHAAAPSWVYTTFRGVLGRRCDEMCGSCSASCVVASCPWQCSLHVLQYAAAHERHLRAACRQVPPLLALISQQASAAAGSRKQSAAPSGRGSRRQLQQAQRMPASSSSSSTCSQPRLGSA